jgi:ribosomal protein L37AE/L43A
MKFFVRIDQAGGKYGRFPCPFCGSRADFKFTAGAGWCPKCGVKFMDCGDTPRYRAKGDREKVTHWRPLSVENTGKETLR